MKQLMIAAAFVGLATAGCAQNGILARNACRDGSCSVGNCDCDDTCCGEGGCDVASSRRDSCRVNGGGILNSGGILKTCRACGGEGCGVCRGLASRARGSINPHAGGYPEAVNFNPSPPTGQVAYPYYTVRGPRDFLQANPPSIGPN